jgi:prepilin peptidase CpaA
MTKLAKTTVSIATAAAVVASLVAAAGVPALPGLALIGFLALIVEEDVRRRRIPNLLTFPAFGAAVVWATWTAGPEGLLSAIAGSLVGLAVLALPFVLRQIGAGDVKAVIVIGACVGPALTLELLYWITLASGVMAVAILAARGGLTDLARRWWVAGCISLRSRAFCPVPAPEGSAAASGLPFAVAIGFGVVACEIWGSGCLV